MSAAQVDTATGTGALTILGIAHWFHELFPIMTTIGATCGTILAVHGVWKLLYGFIHKIKQEIDHSSPGI